MRQASHHENAECGSNRRNEVHKWYSEWTRTFWIGVPQHHYPDANQREREQCTDVGQIVRLTRVANQRPERDENAGENGGDVRRPIPAVHFARAMGVKTVTSHHKNDLRLTVMKNA